MSGAIRRATPLLCFKPRAPKSDRGIEGEWPTAVNGTDNRMRTGRIPLWSVAILLFAHCFIAMVTLPEFHALGQTEFQQYLDKTIALSAASKEAVQMELIKGRWNGQYGENLAERT